MDAETVQRLAKNTDRLRAESVVICSTCEGLIVLSRQTRGQHRVLSREIAQHHAASHLSKLHRLIGRRLRAGRLPYGSVAVIGGAPAAGGSCDACDQPFAAPQLAMTVPMGDAFIRLHADCFMVWNEERRSKLGRARSA